MQGKDPPKKFETPAITGLTLREMYPKDRMKPILEAVREAARKRGALEPYITDDPLYMELDADFLERFFAGHYGRQTNWADASERYLQDLEKQFKINVSAGIRES